jgi:hypothetical protein
MPGDSVVLPAIGSQHIVMSIIARRLAGAAPWARAIAGILTALMLADCGSEHPTGPPGLEHRPDATASHTITSLGTYSIPIPADNTNSYALCCNYTTTSGAQSLTGTGIVIPAGTLYRVRVRGRVTVAPNPAHQAAYPNNSDYSASGTYGPGGTSRGGAELLVIMQLHNVDGSGVITVNLSGAQTGTGAPDTASTQILYAAKAAELWVGRVGITGGTNDNCCHWGIGSYALTASQTATVEQLTNFVHLTATPAFVHSGQQVTFKVDNDDGTPQGVSGWTWARDPGTSANPPNGCFWAINPCTAAVFGSGTMTARTDYGAPSAHVTVYTNFTLDADSTTVHVGDTVTFTPKYDGHPGNAARWRWAPDDSSGDTVACDANLGTCKKKIHAAGTMWAYTATSGGDSASKHVSVLARRKLLLSPADTIWVWSGSAVTFVASADGGAALSHIHWSADDASLQGVRRPPASRGGARRNTTTAVGSTTCADDVETCQDESLGAYIRSVTATVDDSIQIQSVIVEAVEMPASPDSASLMLPEPTNPKEILYCFHHPLNCRDVRAMRDTALKFAFDSATAHDTVAVDNIYDAWRYALWSALMTYAFGADQAKIIGDNHEYGEIDSSDPKRHNASCMDLTTTNEAARSRLRTCLSRPLPS